MVALAFLAAEAAAHAPADNAHRVHRHMQGMGDLVLDLARVLGRGMHLDIAALQRDHQRGLAFQIEMLLPADLEPAFDQVRGAGQRGLDVAAGPDPRAVLEAGIGCQRLVHGQDRRRRLGLDPGEPRGAPGRLMAFGGDQEQRLAQIMDSAVGQQGLVMERGRAVRVGAQIVGRPGADHAGRGAHRGQVDRDQPPGGDRAQPEGQMHRVRRRRDVVHIAGLPGDVELRGIVGKGGAHGHGITSSALTAPPWLSHQTRDSRFRATSSR